MSIRTATAPRTAPMSTQLTTGAGGNGGAGGADAGVSGAGADSDGWVAAVSSCSVGTSSCGDGGVGVDAGVEATTVKLLSSPFTSTA
jgi:hypothetical protein